MSQNAKPRLNLFSITMIVVSLVIGMGIFRTSKDAAVAALTPSVFFGAWVVAGLVAICGALTYAEIGSRYPVTGGYYKVFAYAYHPSVAFAINCIILISNAASVSGVALIGSEYIAPVVFPGNATDLVKAMIAMFAIIVFYGVNLLGLKLSSRTQNFLMLIKIGMLLVLIAALFFPALYSNTPPPVNQENINFAALLVSFGLALKATSFTYGGYQQTINFGEEVENPQKNIPRGIFTGIIIIITLYCLVSFSYYKIIGFENLKLDTPDTRGIAAQVADKMFGPMGGYVASILLFIAVLAYVNVSLLSNPRVMYAMSQDGILPAAFTKKDEKKDVLTVSLTVFSAICVIVLFFAKKFNQILSFTIFLDSIGMATSAATLFILRKRTRHLDGTGIYKMKLYPLLPIIFILAYLFIAIMIAISDTDFAIIGTLVFLFFLGVYFLITRFKNQKNMHGS